MSCNSVYKSVDAGSAGCMFKYAKKIFMFPPLKNDGSEWSFSDYSAITSASITAAVNAAAPKDRIYPSPKIGKYTPVVSDPEIEETKVTMIVLDDGKYSFDIEILSDEGADSIMAAAFNTHEGDNIWLVDKYGKLYCYVDTDGKTILPIPTDSLRAQFKHYDLEGTTTQKVILKIVLDNTVDIERLVTIDAATLGFNLNSIDATIQASKMFSSYSFMSATAMSVFIAAGRYLNPLTGLTTSDVAGVVVGGSALADLTLTADTTKGAGWYNIAFTNMLTVGQQVQLTFTKTGFNFSDLNTKVSAGYSA